MDQRIVDTPIGRIVISASQRGVTRVEFSDIEVSDCENHHLDIAENWICAYFRNEGAELPQLDASKLTDFQSRVCKKLIVHAPYSETTTYGQLASAVGSPRASRAVGSVMARQPWPLLVPCHRVLQSDGGLGNYSAGDGPSTKKWLLEHESK